MHKIFYISKKIIELELNGTEALSELKFEENDYHFTISASNTKVIEFKLNKKDYEKETKKQTIYYATFINDEDLFEMTNDVMEKIKKYGISVALKRNWFETEIDKYEKLRKSEEQVDFSENKMFTLLKKQILSKYFAVLENLVENDVVLYKMNVTEHPGCDGKNIIIHRQAYHLKNFLCFTNYYKEKLANYKDPSAVKLIIALFFLTSNLKMLFSNSIQDVTVSSRSLSAIMTSESMR